MTHLCAISFKPCWRDANGNWYSSGGFPLQMAAIGSLFSKTTLVIVETSPQAGGIALPEWFEVVPLRRPKGQDFRRKLSVLSRLPYYVKTLGDNIRRADVVHTPLPGDIPLLGMVVALILRKRLIARYGGSWFVTNQTTIMNRITRSLIRLFAGGLNVMLATGDYSVAPAPNVRWIFVSAISQSELMKSTPVLDRGLSKPARLIYVGRLSPEKGVQNLIRAFAQMTREDTDVYANLIVVGDGPQRGDIARSIVEHGLAQHVVLTGQLEREQLFEQLHRSDLLILPSLTEGYPKASLEALMCGVPVLATNVGSLQSIVGANFERGWIIPPGDVTALREMLYHILTNPLDWPALRARCRGFVEGHTLEDWREAIGKICAEQWGWKIVDGKLTP